MLPCLSGNTASSTWKFIFLVTSKLIGFWERCASRLLADSFNSLFAFKCIYTPTLTSLGAQCPHDCPTQTATRLWAPPQCGMLCRRDLTAAEFHRTWGRGSQAGRENGNSNTSSALKICLHLFILLLKMLKSHGNAWECSPGISFVSRIVFLEIIDLNCK